MKSETNHVLLLAYLFPPIGGIAVQRPLKFARYLPTHFWQTTVLTSANVSYATMDPTLVSEIPAAVKVERLRDPLAALAARANISTSNQPPAQVAAAVQDEDSPARVGVLARCKAWLRGILKRTKDALLVPDEAILWSLHAGLVGTRLVRQQQMSCIYTTSGPHSTHLAGWMIHRATGVPWVADFRDPWTDNLHYHHQGLRRRFEAWLEKRVFYYATAIVTVTDGFHDLFAAKYPLAKGRIHVIRNGVDPADFPTAVATRQTGSDESAITLQRQRRAAVEPCDFFYAGILYPKRSPATFLHALAAAIASGQIDRSEVRAEFAGVFDYPGHSDHLDLVHQLGLADIITLRGYLPREQVLARMKEVAVLLLIGENVPEAKLYVPGKLYEYLLAAAPVLAFLEDGEGAQLLRASGVGVVVAPDDLEAAQQEIVRLVQAHRAGTLPRSDSTYGERFTRQAQTTELAALMGDLVARKAR